MLNAQELGRFHFLNLRGAISNSDHDAFFKGLGIIFDLIRFLYLISYDFKSKIF